MEPNVVARTKNMSEVIGEYQKTVDCSFQSVEDHKDIVEVFEALSNMKSAKETDGEDVRADVSDVSCSEEGLAGRISLVELGKDGENGKASLASEVVEAESRGAKRDGDGVVEETGSEVGVSATEDSGGPEKDAREEGEGVPDVAGGESAKGEVAPECVDVSPRHEAISDEKPPASVPEEADVCGNAEEEASRDDFKGKKRKVEEIEEAGEESEGKIKPDSEEESEGEKKMEERRRKRRKRKSKRKTPSDGSSSENPSSSSGEERESRVEPQRPKGQERRPKEQERGSEDEQQFCLRWNNFLTNITSQFGTLRDDEDFVDVTLACGGMQVKAHRVVLSACSPYFKRMFKSVPYCQHPVVFLEGIQPSHLLSLLAFMYCGEVGVRRGQLPSLLSTAHALQIRGLTEMGSSSNSGDDEENVILSAKKQASAVERALKDIGLCESEKDLVNNEHIGKLQSGSPSKLSKRDFGRASPVITRHRRSEMQKQASGVAAMNENKEHPLANSMNGPREPSKEEDLSNVRQERIVASTQIPSPCVVRNAAVDVPALRGVKKNNQSSFVVNNGPTIDELSSRVNSQSPVSENTVLCDMAANLVDVRIGSPLPEERHRGIICVDGAAVPPPTSSQSPRLGERDGGNLNRHGWDPGEERSSHFEPRIDLVTGSDFGLVKPKEEAASYSEVEVEEVSLSHVVEPKMEYQDLSSAEGETSRSCGIPVATEPSVSLTSSQQQKYRPHILGTPIVTGIQQRMPASTSSTSSSHLYAHFLPPMTSTSIPHHLSSPGNVSLTTTETMRGHLKWEMPRPCPVCRRIYSNNSNLRRHLRTIHEEYYEKYM